MGKSSISLFSVLLLISVLWKPAYSNDKCSIGCKGSPQHQQFAPGTKYNYGVEGTVKIALSGAEKQETGVQLLGQVSVIATGNCAHELVVQNLVISGPDGKKHPSPPGIEKPVQFSLQDGRLSAEICAEEGDTRRSLNIKRAIISLLQTETKSGTQYDIFGACPTEISSSQEGGAVLVHRARDLSRCAHREQNDLVSTVFNPTAEIKESQILQSSLNVESKINNGVPEKIFATEKYAYKPFSVGDNGATAEVHTALTLTGKSGGGPQGHCTIPRTIIFEAPHGTTVAPNNVNSVLQAVKETARSIGHEATEKSAGNFAQLVRILRATGKDDLLKVFSQVKGNSVEKRVFLDALLRTATGPSVEAAIELLKAHSLDDLEQLIVFTSLGNAKHVTEGALKEATSLLDQPNIHKEVFIDVGSLAGAYCRQHRCHSTHSEAIAQLSQKYIAKIGNCKPKNKNDEDFAVAALKGIRNILHLEDSLIDKLVSAAQDPNVKARVKAAVLDAFQADPCSAKIKKASLDILKNRQLDSEIRIKAYLSVIACPCSRSANEIKNLLDSEPVHQVGRFITSSLRAIRASANPDKYLAQQHYGQIRIPKKFNVDDRKYSFYREESFNIDALGLGGSLDQTVIYSQDSFLPRSVAFNLTTQLFGHNVNVLELEGRQGNLDLVVEHFLGPKGILRTRSPQELFDAFLKTYSETSDKVNSALHRGRRSVKSDIDAFDKNLKAEATAFDNELDLDLYLQIFGSDNVFLSLGNSQGFNLDDAITKLVRFLSNTADKATHLSKELHANLLFIEADLSYPTLAGLPLRLDLTGSATARIDLASNFDIADCIKNPQSAKIDIKFVPSTDIEIAAALLIDADSIATGLKVVTNLHSSTGGHVIAKVLENGKGFDLQLGLPVDKQEILVASNELIIFTAAKGQKETQKLIHTGSPKKEYSGCFDQLSGLLGLTLCGEVVLPFSVNGPDAQASISQFLARYPVAGVSKVKLVLEKNDLKGYHIRGVVREDGGRTSFELLFDAEGSQNRRTQITGEKIYTPNEIGVKLALDSPIKVLSGELSYRRTPSEIAALAKAKIDNQEYYGRIGFNAQGNQQRSVYKPVFEYQLADEKHSVEVDGQVIRESNGPVTKYTLDNLKIKLPQSKEPIAIEGYFSSQENARNVDFALDSKFANVKGSLKNTDLNLEFTNQLNPLFNFKLKGCSEFGDVIKNEIDVIYSNDLKDQSKRVILNQFLKYKVENLQDFNVITKNKFEIVNVPFKIHLDADVDPKKVETEIELKAPGQQGKLDLKARSHIKNPEDYSVRLLVSGNDKEVEVFSKRDVINQDKSKFENFVNIKGVGKYELAGVVLHKNHVSDTNIGASGNLRIAGAKSENIRFDIGLIRNPQLYSSHAKISNNKGEVLDYLMKSTRGPNSNGQLKFILKDAVSANGQYKVTDSDGKGNGALIIDFKKSQRKVKADVKFQATEQLFNGDFDIYLNVDKDNKDKICFTTNNKKTDKLIESKNKLEYGGKTSELNIQKVGNGITGLTKASVEIVLPTERCLTFKVDRDIKVQDGVYNGQATAAITDSPKRGAPGSSIIYQGKMVNTNFEKDHIDYEGHLKLSLKDEKKLENLFSLKNIPEGNDKFKFDFKTQVNGNLLPKPASISASGTYVDSFFKSDDKYQLKASYGNDLGVTMGGVFVVKDEEGGETKYVDDYTITLQLPFEKAHDIKLVNTIIIYQQAGKDEAEYTIVESAQINGDVYKIDANGKVSPRAGAGTVKLLVPHVDPVILDANYKINKGGDKIESYAEVKAKYGKGRNVALSLDTTATPNGNDIVFKANAPQLENLKKLEVTVHSKNPSPDTYSSSVIVDADGRVYKSESTVVLSKAHPILDLKYTSPSNPKTSKIYVKGSSLSSTQGKVEAKIENIKDFSLDLVSEANVQKDNVNLKVQANSEKLALKNFVGQIQSKDAGSGKRLEFHSTNDGKNVLSGSTSFISKQEGQKTIIEGSGSVKIKDEQKSANFKYIRTILTEGNEKGVETFFNVAFGDRSYVGESRVTNYEYKNSHVYCEEKKQCAHAEIQSKIDVSKPGVIANIVNAGFDLRKLGVAPEVGLVIRDEVSSKQLPQYTLDLHANKGDRKYYLRIYNTPVFGHSKSGITIELPQRTLVLEQSVSYPTDKALPFPIKGELVLDLDKTKSGHKAAARFLVDVTDGPDKQSAIAEFGFKHPSIEKEARVKIEGASIRHGENSIRLESTAAISHPILGHDRESKIILEASPNSLKFLINTPLVKVIDLDASTTVQEKLQKADIRFTLLEGKPVQFNAIARDYQYFELSSGYIAEADRKLTLIGRIDPEKRVDFSADIILSGQKKNIAHAALFLQDNLVKSDYGVDQNNQDYFVNALKNDLKSLGNRIQQLGDKASNDFKEITRRVEPTAKRLQQAYSDDINKIYQEIADDQALKELSQAVHDIAQFVAKLINEVIQATRPILEKLVDVYDETGRKILEIYEKQIEPQIRQLFTAVSTLLREYLDGVIEVVAHATAITTDFFEKHRPELEELTNTIAEIFRDLTRLIVAHLKEYRKQIAATIEEVVQFFKDLPIVGAIQDKYNELSIPDQVLGLLDQLRSTIKPLLPTPETQQFADTLVDYLMKKLRREKCDDNKELRVVYQRAVAAAASLVQFARSQLAVLNIPTTPTLEAFGLSGFSGSSAPGLGGVPVISIIKQVLNGDLPSLQSIINAYRPRSLNPLDEVPAKLRAIVVNGQHIFTFDGRHLTFPGSCRYVLAHDHVDRNFTLAMQLQAGHPKALVLEDKSGNVVEIKDNGQVSLNGANHGFPIEEKDSFAFRQVNGRVGLGTTYGLMALCTSKLEVCYIEVNGFYLGKLRGLLGDGNNEPYDDFRLPNGKICNSESEFGNAYRLTRSCPAVQVPEHSHDQLHHAPLPAPCEQVFGGSSPLRALSLVLDVSPFRQACIHAVSSNSANGLHEACDLARGYTALAVSGLLPAVLPEVCLQCTDGDKPRAVGETFDVKLPNKLADIVVIVETTKSNQKTFKELVVPLVSQIVDSLKAKKITDIKVYLVGATSKFPYPIVYDTDLKLKNAKVIFNDKSRYDFIPSIKTHNEKVDAALEKFVNILNDVRFNLGLTNVEAAYASTLTLNLRPGSVRHGIAVVGDVCFPTNPVITAINAAIRGEVLKNVLYTHSIVATTPDLAVGHGKNPDNVVGFDKEQVILVGDKKREKSSEELRESLQYGANSCIDLIDKTGGLIISSSNFNKLDAARHKQFLTTASNVIIQGMVSDAVEQTCTCAYADPFSVRSFCVTKSRKPVARRRK